MMYTIWILTTFIAGAFGLPRDVSTSDHNPGIIGGDPAGRTPYMVALTAGLYARKFICGGSLVSTRTVLTAAHCLIGGISPNGTLNRTLRATVGTNRWNVSGVSYKIKKYIMHPDYVPALFLHDIALLMTTTRVKLSNSVRTVPLHYGFIGGNVETRVTGWGVTDMNVHEPSPSLQQLTANTVDGNVCVAKMGPLVQTLVMLCTFHSKNHGTCMGDSGSPIVLMDPVQQVGIVSWGKLCGGEDPDVSVRISAYKGWLEHNIVK